MVHIRENVLLAPFTVYSIGGQARYFAEARTGEEIHEAVAFGRDKGVPFFILGAGSNILVSDTGFPGIVIHVVGGEIGVRGETIRADAGVKMAALAAAASRASLTGFEWGIGIPGSVGGSARGNAGCFGGGGGDGVSRVGVLDTNDRELLVREFSSGDCEFGYRHSIFKLHPEWIILSVTLSLEKGNSDGIRERIQRITRERTQKQDIGTKSCGCIFKNAAWDAAGGKEFLLRRFPEFFEIADRPNIPAAFLVDRAGLKGERAGNAVISQKHANFFVNDGGASAEDVRELIRRAQEGVGQKYGIELEPEIQYVGF